MPSTAPLPFVHTSEYLEGELRSQVRHEYVAGHLFAMVGASEAHNLIALNIAVALRTHLRGGPCRVFIADMKVYAEGARAFYYPDVMVTCDATDTEVYYKSRPCLIVEVLSPATETIDRREKLLAYQHIETLQEYILVAQDRIHIEMYRRDAAGHWWVSVHTAGEEIHLESVDYTLTTASVYEDVVV